VLRQWSSTLSEAKGVPFAFSINPGISFSLLKGQPHLALAVAAATVIFGAVVCAVNKKIRTTPGLPLLWTGAASNLTDRLLYGGVIDWIPIGAPGGRTLGSLNFADLYLCAGFLLFLLSSFRRMRKQD
jgi:signal peptidase II